MSTANSSGVWPAYVYKYDSELIRGILRIAWKQAGSFRSRRPGMGDFAGFSISLSGDGKRLAVGAPQNDAGIELRDMSGCSRTQIPHHLHLHPPPTPAEAP